MSHCLFTSNCVRPGKSNYHSIRIHVSMSLLISTELMSLPIQMQNIFQRFHTTTNREVWYNNIQCCAHLVTHRSYHKVQFTVPKDELANVLSLIFLWDTRFVIRVGWRMRVSVMQLTYALYGPWKPHRVNSGREVHEGWGRADGWSECRGVQKSKNEHIQRTGLVYHIHVQHCQYLSSFNHNMFVANTQ